MKKSKKVTWAKWVQQADGSKVRMGLTVHEVKEARTPDSVTLEYKLYTETRYRP